MFQYRIPGLSLLILFAALIPAASSAGLNSAAVAHLYWQAGSTGSALAARDNTNGTCQLVVTCTGLTNFRGADVQIYFARLDFGYGTPEAWQAQPGGCAEGYITGFAGGRGGTLFPNAFSATPVVPGTVVSQNAEFLNTGDCRTPHGLGLFWLSAAGSSGAVRSPVTEYAIWAIAFDFYSSVDSTGLACDGGFANPKGMCLQPVFRDPCASRNPMLSLDVFDSNLSEDFPQYPTGTSLLWFGGGYESHCCIFCNSVRRTTWGAIKRAYR